MSNGADTAANRISNQGTKLSEGDTNTRCDLLRTAHASAIAARIAAFRCQLVQELGLASGSTLNLELLEAGVLATCEARSALDGVTPNIAGSSYDAATR